MLHILFYISIMLYYIIITLFSLKNSFNSILKYDRNELDNQ